MKWTFFQLFSLAVFGLFMSVLVFVLVISFSRESKASLLSMANVHKVRFEQTAAK